MAQSSEFDHCIAQHLFAFAFVFQIRFSLALARTQLNGTHIREDASTANR
jgi:hypothetical protein